MFVVTGHDGAEDTLQVYMLIKHAHLRRSLQLLRVVPHRVRRGIRLEFGRVDFAIVSGICSEFDMRQTRFGGEARSAGRDKYTDNCSLSLLIGAIVSFAVYAIWNRSVADSFRAEDT